jgi:hypothetical protein
VELTPKTEELTPKTEPQDPQDRWRQHGILGVMCVLVIGIYAYAAHLGSVVSLSRNATDAYYNLLVQGFRDGQLSLRKEVPPWLVQFADPYDPTARAVDGSEARETWDLSYYKGKLYLYFGVTPALLLFWPYVALTGHYLPQKVAVVIFCVMGFLASVGLLRELWRHYFIEASVGVAMACTLALGLATGVPVMLSLLPRSETPEVAVSCGYMLTMLALWAILRALREPGRRCRWLAAASLTYGLALGARPSLLFGAIILLVPVAHAWRERRQIPTLLMAATVPIVLVGLGLMFYNSLRFDNPFEFGMRYQLTGYRHDTVQHFSLRYLWFNFWAYFLEPTCLSSLVPFVNDITVPPLPTGHGAVENHFGVLTNVPLVWLALAVPLAWRGRSAEAHSILAGFSAAVALFFGTCALTLCLYFFVAIRFEVEFLPALGLLAVIGVWSLERALVCQPVWRRAARWGWGILLGFSVVFNLLATI